MAMSGNAADSMLPALAVGDKLDNFEIVEQIGSGGTSIVWKAYDRLLSRHVAVKQVLARGGDEELKERVLREAQLQKKIASKHKHLTHVIDVVDDQRGLFIVMEYVDGPSLEQILAQQKTAMDQRQALGIIGATALALQAIHEQGAVHRDLKPSNILLSREGGLKVCDFGLATLIAEQEAPDAGTVRYMAPEMFSQGDVDGRADIYALGVVAYEMLAGRDRFDEAFRIVLRDQRNQSLRWMKWHTNPRAVAPPLSQINTAVPQTLSDLVARMMEKDRDRRVAGAGELVEAIRRHFTGEGQVDAGQLEAARAQPVGSDEATAPLPKKGKLKLILAANLLLLACVGVGFLMYEQSKENKAAMEVYSADRTRYEVARQAADDGRHYQAYTTFVALAQRWPDDDLGRYSLALAQQEAGRIELASRSYDAAIGHLLEADESGVLDRDELSRLRTLAEERKALEGVFGEIDQALAEGDFAQADERLTFLGDQQGVLSPPDRQRLDDYRDQLRSLRRKAGIESYLAEIDVALNAGDRARAKILLQDAQEVGFGSDPRIVRHLRKIRDQEEYEQALRLARQYERIDDFAGAKIEYEKVLAIQQERDVQPELTVAQVQEAIENLEGERLYREGQAFERNNRRADAIAAYKQAAGFNHQGAQARLDQLEADSERAQLVARGRQHARRRQFDEAITAFERAQAMRATDDVAAAIREARIGESLDRGWEHVKAKEYKEALAAFDEVLALDPNNGSAQRGRTDVRNWQDYFRLMAEADALRDQKQFGESVARFKQAQAIYDTPDVRERIRDTDYDSWFSRARNHAAAGQWTAARAAALQAKDQKDTPEVNQLLAKIEPNIPPETPGDADGPQ